MKRAAALVVLLVAGSVSVRAQGSVQTAGTVISYMLLDGSFFVDGCLVCERPTILQTLRGTFDLVLEQDIAPYTRYAVRNVNFTTSPGFAGVAHLTGQGSYVRFEEFARLQDMTLELKVQDDYTNRLAYFTNDTRVATAPFPLIQVNLTQTNGTLLQTYSLQLMAAPIREIWFSTERSFVSTNGSNSYTQISDGDLISNRGRVVKRNRDIAGKLGFMPVVADLGLDAVQVARGGEILFSLPASGFSESLGLIQNGDLLSDRGVIMKRNQDLMAGFKPPTTEDAGLDALQVMPDGEILFSIRSNVVVNSTLTLRPGDILSDRGYVFQSQRDLLANFRPTVTNVDFGLDALSVLPGGEIWFSVEKGFTDTRLGAIQGGDLLSNRGYRVFSSQELLAAFAPQDPALDYGLDALFIVTDTCSAQPPPRIVKYDVDGGQLHFGWQGSGAVFQLESAPTLSGPWEPCSEILPGLSCETATDKAGRAIHLYRVRQW